MEGLIGQQGREALELYNAIERDFMVKYQYGSPVESPRYAELVEKLDALVRICQEVGKIVSTS